MAKEKAPRRTTPIGTGCFVHVLTPEKDRKDKDKPGKYKILLVITPDDFKADDMRALRLACVETAEAKFGTKARDMIKKGKIKMPWRPNEDYEEYGAPFDSPGYFMNLSSTQAPGVVDRRAKPIKDASQIYSGARYRCTYAPWAYDTDGNKGVTLLLNNVQKVADGERLSGRTEASDDFEAVEGEEEDPDDLDI